MFAGQNPENYQCTTNSIRLNGQSTSIRLENLFWELLKEMALIEKRSVPQFISMLHLEIIKSQGEIENFTSLLRCACIIHMEKSKNLKIKM